MSGSGYLWIVQEVDPAESISESASSSDNLAVLATYGSGTLLVQGGELVHDNSRGFLSGLTEEGLVHLESRPYWMTNTQTETDAASNGSSSSKDANQPSLPFPRLDTDASPSPSRSASNSVEDDGRITRSYKRLLPLACLSLHEHAYMVDHGVWGKPEYVRGWMNNLDWDLVAKRMARDSAGSDGGQGAHRF